MASLLTSRIPDFVIVGAGSAGCVLANRLSEAGASVLLLEAGGRNLGPLIAMPAATDLYGIGNPLYDWRYRTAPDPTRAGRSDVWPRGRGLGGSSAINGLVYIRGVPADFAAWVRLGAKNWSWEDVLPAYESTLDRGDGRGGLHVETLVEVHPATKLFIAAAEASGLPRTEPISTATEPGVGLVQATYRRGRRMSNAAAFLRPAMGRPNLAVMTGARVERVLFGGTRAIGLLVRRWGRSFEIRAGQVILAAGAVASPHLLLRSGVGPAGELRGQPERIVADLPGVGRNLQEHAGVYLTHQIAMPTLNGELGWLSRIGHGYNWWRHGRGAATSPGGQALAYLRTVPGLEAPDIQVQFTPIGYKMVEGELAVPRVPSVTAVVSLNRPFSRGRIRLGPGDGTPPIIEPDLFTDGADLDTLIRGVRSAASILSHGHLAEVLGPALPGGLPVKGSDASLAQAIRQTAGTNYHPAGTCRMGAPSDAAAVVDSRLSLIGVEGISVIDASVMPTIVSANLNATVTMIAERGAGFLLGQT